ncbi:hypothetical protein ACGFIJ_17190 [Microbispora bryophytorum]|uniref:hypothetical protein n=1 Tax=Microbispora bryophytorum TaxID=1460882 RepID=UPI00371718A0
MYLREPEPGDGHAAGECEEGWLLRFWPIRDVFDPIMHAAPFSYIARGVLYYSIDLEPEQLVQPPARREVPVPVSAAADWASLRAAGSDIEDGVDLTLAACTLPRATYRAGRSEGLVARRGCPVGSATDG